MSKILMEDERKEFMDRMAVVYNNFKSIGGWNNTQEREANWREGIIDLCDSLIYVSSPITYEISTLRSDLEDLFDNMDNEENDE